MIRAYRNINKRLALAALLASSSPLVLADDCTGVDILVTLSADTKEIGKNHSITSFKSASVLVSSDSAYDQTSGECTGAVLATPDGKVQAMGYCARRDKDGDTYSLSWHTPPGADKGMWKFTNGTGKFAGRQGSGWFQDVMADGAMSYVKWGGNCR